MIDLFLWKVRSIYMSMDSFVSVGDGNANRSPNKPGQFLDSDLSRSGVS